MTLSTLLTWLANDGGRAAAWVSQNSVTSILASLAASAQVVAAVYSIKTIRLMRDQTKLMKRQSDQSVEQVERLLTALVRPKLMIRRLPIPPKGAVAQFHVINAGLAGAINVLPQVRSDGRWSARWFDSTVITPQEPWAVEIVPALSKPFENASDEVTLLLHYQDVEERYYRLTCVLDARYGAWVVKVQGTEFFDRTPPPDRPSSDYVLIPMGHGGATKPNRIAARLLRFVRKISVQVTVMKNGKARGQQR